MRRVCLLFILIQTCLACKTSHSFDLRDTTPVKSEDAPYINLLVKKKIANLNGNAEASEGSVIKVEELAPSKSLLVDFDKGAFLKIIKSACDSSVQDLAINSQDSARAEVAWADRYRATIEIIQDQFVVSCHEAS